MKAYKPKRFNNRVGARKQMSVDVKNTSAANPRQGGAIAKTNQARAPRRVGASSKGLTSVVKAAENVRVEKFMGEAQRVGAKALPKAGSSIAQVAKTGARIAGGAIGLGASLMVTPRSLGSGELKNPPKAPPSALDASLSSAPSKASRKQEPAAASFTKVASSNKDMSPKTNSALNKMSQSKPTVSPPSNKVFGGSAPAFKESTKAPVTNRDFKASTTSKSGGFLSGLKSALTKRPTARGTSEYEQIMTDIQPSRKKKR